MNRITPTDSKEARLKQALAAGEFVGYENLSASDREQIDRLLYADDLTETQWKQDREGVWNERLNHLDDIAVSLGYKPSELYKHEVLDAVMKVRGEEYESEIKAVAEKKSKCDSRVSGRRMEYLRRGNGLADDVERAPRALGELTEMKAETVRTANSEPSADEINAMLTDAGA